MGQKIGPPKRAHFTPHHETLVYDFLYQELACGIESNCISGVVGIDQYQVTQNRTIGFCNISFVENIVWESC
jgi:hypothetical protein